MTKLMTIEWEIHDTRKPNGGFKTGTSKLMVKTKSIADAINKAISFASNLPSWEFERNNIDLEEYREYPICTYYYTTKLSRILKIENVK